MITNVCLVWLQMAISYTTDAIQMECSQPTTPMEVSVLLLKHVPPTDNAMLRAQIWMVQINAVCHRPVWQGPWLRGWFSSLQEFGKNGRPFISCLHFFFFWRWRLACTHWFHFLGQDQSTVAQWAEMTVVKCSLVNYMWDHFPK